MLQALQIQPPLTLDGVVERPLTNSHDLQEGAQRGVRVPVLPKQLGGTGDRLLVIERDGARHTVIVTVCVAIAKNGLTRQTAPPSICSDRYRLRIFTAFGWQGAIVTAASK